jgi:hypothetical protein
MVRPRNEHHSDPRHRHPGNEHHGDPWHRRHGNEHHGDPRHRHHGQDNGGQNDSSSVATASLEVIRDNPYGSMTQQLVNPYLPTTQQSDNPTVQMTQRTERYLRVSNQTGQPLTVYVQLPGAAEPLTYEFEQNQTADLTIEDVRLSASKVLIWAETNRGKWTDNKDKELVLVSAPYTAANMETFTHTFTP